MEAVKRWNGKKKKEKERGVGKKGKNGSVWDGGVLREVLGEIIQTLQVY